MYLIIFVVISFLTGSNVFAADSPPSTSGSGSGKSSGLNFLKTAGETAGYSKATNEYSLASFVGSIIYVFLGFIGVIFLAFTVYAGFLWMTAGGDEKKIEDAQKYIKNGVIGMLMVLSSLGVTALILNFIIGSTLSQ